LPESPANDSSPQKVEIVLYSDFQCPFCAQLAPAIRQIEESGIDGVTVRISFKNFPLSIHANAKLAHQAALAAKQQGRFWELHDLLFANPQRVRKDDLLGYAEKLGLDVARFQKDMESERTRKAIEDDVAEGTKIGVSGTPSYTINGKMYSGTRSFAQ